MENQNIQWENWEEQPQENNDQPQINWGEQPQESIPTWGKQPQKSKTETDNYSWEEQPKEPKVNIPNWGEPTPSSTNSESEDSYTLLDSPSKITISPELYNVFVNNKKALNEVLSSNLTPFDQDGRYDFSPLPNTELGNIIESIVKIGSKKGLKIDSCFIYKANPNESSLNIFRGKPTNTFIYHLDDNSGDVVLDLSSISGPSVKSHPSKSGTLAILPGWIPYRIGRNISSQESFLIVGNFV